MPSSWLSGGRCVGKGAAEKAGGGGERVLTWAPFGPRRAGRGTGREPAATSLPPLQGRAPRPVRASVGQRPACFLPSGWSQKEAPEGTRGPLAPREVAGMFPLPVTSLSSGTQRDRKERGRGQPGALATCSCSENRPTANLGTPGARVDPALRSRRVPITCTASASHGTRSSGECGR